MLISKSVNNYINYNENIYLLLFQFNVAYNCADKRADFGVYFKNNNFSHRKILHSTYKD